MVKPRVTLSAPAWHLSGVNTMNARLAGALQARGFDVEILLTSAPEISPHSARFCDDGFPLGQLPLAPQATWPQRWSALARHLTARAPCVYFPGYDFDTASICPALPAPVAIVGVLHSDEEIYYSFGRRLGRSWNAIVGVSRFLAAEAARLFPGASARSSHVPYGVDAPAQPPARALGEGPLRAIYAGRLAQHQKRVLDLPPLLAELERRRAPVQITVAGGGREEAALCAACEAHVRSGRVQFAGNVANDAVLDLLAAHDALLLFSDFEGLPLILLEGMARGCAPVVTDIRSGIPDLVENGVSGFRIPVGDVGGFAAALARLHAEPALRAQLHAAAHARICGGRYRLADMADSYAEITERVFAEARGGRAPGRTGIIAPPRHLRRLARWKAAASGAMRRLLRPAALGLP